MKILSITYKSKKNNMYEFEFKNLTREVALRLAKYYTEQLHAVKSFDFDVETE